MSKINKKEKKKQQSQLSQNYKNIKYASILSQLVLSFHFRGRPLEEN